MENAKFNKLRTFNKVVGLKKNKVNKGRAYIYFGI